MRENNITGREYNKPEGGEPMSKPTVNKSDSQRGERMPPLTETMSGAEQYIMDIATHVSHPSDDGVEEMRWWSIENKK